MIHAFTEMTDDCHLPDTSVLEPDYWEDKDQKHGDLDRDGVRLEYRRLLSQFVCIRHHKLLLQSPRSFRIHRSRSVVQLYFVLRGHCTLIHDQQVLVSLGEMEHAAFYLMDNALRMEIAGGEEVEIVDILLDPDFIERYLPLEGVQFPETGLNHLAGFSMEISPQMLTVIFDTLQCGFEGYFKRLYIRSKVIELMILRCVQYENRKRIGKNDLRKADIEKMNMIHEMITAYPGRQYSLAFLAKAAGTNEHYLKTHFKMLYGKTVFSYLTSLRMERARELLLSGTGKISDIAEAVGYRHSTHFTQAFKKHFGYLPLKLKKNINKLMAGASLSLAHEVLCLTSAIL